ncbi:MAG: cell division protein SepF [Lachnospiraceae bacterium]|nr:cell division protein SepF [Lachnospiraceae bacterium]
MINIIDWILSKMRLIDIEDEQEEPEQEVVSIEKSWLELVHWKKDKVLEEDSRVYFKNVQTYADCKLVIDNYKMGAVCIYSLEPAANPATQGMVNYICGGLYALDGDVITVGENVFMVTARKEAKCVY